MNKSVIMENFFNPVVFVFLLIIIELAFLIVVMMKE
nr:MAG TPA: hypothetical protein [Caudoviricetes sp.]